MSRSSRTLAIACVMCVAVFGLPTAVAARSSAPPRWVLPVDAEIVSDFDEPEVPYGSGHRGVDLGASDSEVVVAAGDGTVEFAGAVAGSLHVVVRHSNGWRTSYSFLSKVSVRLGTPVRAGEPLGICCDSSAHMSSISDSSLHFGLRIGDDYADPMQLFDPVDLTELVRLAPPQGHQWPGRDESAWAMISEALGLSIIADAVTFVVAGGGLAIDALGDLYVAGASSLVESAETLVLISRDIATLVQSAGALTRWAKHRRECDHDPPGVVPQKDRLMFVAGINSDTDPATGHTNDFEPETVGYAEADVEWFSYAPGDGPYVSSHTHVPIEDSAKNLAGQLRAMQTESPGEPVDLIAHSLGGVVVQTFLKFYYDPSDATFPPLGTVITLDSPHKGAPAATAGDLVGNSWAGSTVIDAAGMIPNISEPSSLVDLSELSDLNQRLADTALPEGIDFVSIGAPLDWTVPLAATHLDGAKNWTVNPEALLNQHSAITTDEAGMTAVSNALAGRAVPCLALGAFIAGELAPALISGVEHAAGLLAQNEARKADLLGAGLEILSG